MSSPPPAPRPPFPVVDGCLQIGGIPLTRLAARPRRGDASHGSTMVTVAGIVAALTSTMTRRGRMMRVMLDDKTASEEIAVFSEVFERHRNLLRPDQLVVVHGKLSRDEYSGGHRLGVERILDLDGARAEHARALRLRMNGQSDAARLAALLGQFRIGEPSEPGCPVEIEYHNGEAMVAVRLGPDWIVRPADALLAQLSDWLSPSGVELVYR